MPLGGEHLPSLRRVQTPYGDTAGNREESMFVRFGLLGDAVVASGGKWTLVGNFNLLWGQDFPLTWALMGLLIRIEGDHREVGEHTLRLDFVNDLGERLTAPPAQPFTFNPPRAPGFPVDFVIGIQIANLQIPGPGNYDFTIRVDETYLDSVPLYVRTAEDLTKLQKKNS